MQTKNKPAPGVVVATLLLGLALAGCDKPGPAEKAGKAVDNAVEKTGKQLEKAGDAIEKAVKDDKK